MDFYVTLVGHPPLLAELPVDLGDGYEMKALDVRIPNTRFKAFKTNDLIEYRLGGEKLRRRFPGGHFDTVQDVVMQLNHMLKSDDENQIKFVFDKFQNKVQVSCTPRSSVMLPRAICSALALPYTTIKNTMIGSIVSYNEGREYGLIICDALETSIYNNKLLPILCAVHLDEKARSNGYRKLRRILGQNEIKIELKNSADLSAITPINGECLIVLHLRKCT